MALQTQEELHLLFSKFKMFIHLAEQLDNTSAKNIFLAYNRLWLPKRI